MGNQVRGQKGKGATDIKEVHGRARSMGMEESNGDSGNAKGDSGTMPVGDDAQCEHGTTSKHRLKVSS